MRILIVALASAVAFAPAVTVATDVHAAPRTAAERGEMVSADQVPAPVKATAEKEAKGATLGSFTKETEKGKTFYEVEITKNGKQRYVHISPEGKVLKRESAKREAKQEMKQEKKESTTK